MKNEINQLLAERAKRPRESHMKVSTKVLDTVLKGVAKQVDEINRLQGLVRERDKQVDALREQVEKATKKEMCDVGVDVG